MRFEAGTPNIGDAIAFGAAVDYLENVGMENIRQHEVQLTQYALGAFKELEEELMYLAPLSPKGEGGIISFHADAVHPHDLGTFLDRDGIAIRTGHHCTMPLMRSLGVFATARASFYLYNTEEEVDHLVDSVKRALSTLRMGPGELDGLYRDEVILDHRRNPRNPDSLEDADITADGVNPFCGDEIHLQIKLDDRGRVSQVGFQGAGCAINQATGSMVLRGH